MGDGGNRRLSAQHVLNSASSGRTIVQALLTTRCGAGGGGRDRCALPSTKAPGSLPPCGPPWRVMPYRVHVTGALLPPTGPHRFSSYLQAGGLLPASSWTAQPCAVSHAPNLQVGRRYIQTRDWSQTGGGGCLSPAAQGRSCDCWIMAPKIPTLQPRTCVCDSRGQKGPCTCDQGKVLRCRRVLP